MTQAVKLTSKIKNRLLRRFRTPEWPPPIWEQLTEFERSVITRVRPFTMTNPERLYALMSSIEYVVKRDIPGAFAECGVWRGGSVLAMILALQELKVNDRDIYLYDTFEGMTKPSDIDVSIVGRSAMDWWKNSVKEQDAAWPEFFKGEAGNYDFVQNLLEQTGYPSDRIHMVKGPVEQTVPGTVPDSLALLRLDTDWYESTFHEMNHLYPLIPDGGVLIIDDYGHWQGSRTAIDEYFANHPEQAQLLNRVDYSCRLVVKS